MPKESSSSDAVEYRPISTTPVLSKVFEKIVTGKLSNFLEGNRLLSLSQFSYPRRQEHVMLCPYCLTVCRWFGWRHGGKAFSVGLLSYI